MLVEWVLPFISKIVHCCLVVCKHLDENVLFFLVEIGKFTECSYCESITRISISDT